MKRKTTKTTTTKENNFILNTFKLTRLQIYNILQYKQLHLCKKFEHF